MEEFEASESAKKTKTIYISTVFGIAMVLLMVGLLGLILVHANNLSRYVKENIVLNIFVDDAAHEADVVQLKKQLETNPMVKEAIYVSKELAARNLQKDLGEDFVKFLGYNPLPPAGQCLGFRRKRLGVDPSTLARWERGEREPAGKFAARVSHFPTTGEATKLPVVTLSG